MNEISTTLYKVNWAYLINNCLNRDFWKNKWKVFEVDRRAFTLSIIRIDVEGRRAVFKLAAGIWDYEIIYVPLSEAHYNVTAFNNSLYGTLRRMLIKKEQELIELLDEYKEALELDTDANDARKAELREQALSSLFDGIDEDELSKSQEDAVDNYVSRRYCSDYSRSNKVVEDLETKHKPEWFGLLALTLGTPEDYNLWLKQQPSVVYADVVEDDYEHTEIKDMEDGE